MNLTEAIFGRRAVCEYKSEPVDEKSIRELINYAVMAPSAANQQLWTFAVIRDQGKLDLISTQAKLHMLASTKGNPKVSQFRSHLEDPQFQIFYHAPALILISAIEDDPWIVEDCALAAENLMLAAYGKGLGSCWIGFAQSYLNTADGKELIGLPPTWIPVAPIIVGHPKNWPASVQRKEPVISWIGQE